MRCVVLAKYLQDFGARVLFLCRPMSGDLCDFIEEQGLPIYRLRETNAQDANIDAAQYQEWLGVSLNQEILESERVLRKRGPFDWLIVEHYALDANWQRRMARCTKRIFVLDDIACSQHHCDVLLNHAYLPRLREKYNTLVSSNCKLLLGPSYYILDPEFHNQRQAVKVSDGRFHRIFVFYGGVDATNETSKVVDAITNIQSHDFQVDIVLTNLSIHKNEISEKILALPNFSLFGQLPNLAEIMGKSNISFGAGGGAVYERMFLGLPSIVTTTAANQVDTIRYMHEENLVQWLGNAEDVGPADLCNSLIQAMGNKKKLREQSNAMTRIVDGEGLNRIEQILGSY